MQRLEQRNNGHGSCESRMLFQNEFQKDSAKVLVTTVVSNEPNIILVWITTYLLKPFMLCMLNLSPEAYSLKSTPNDRFLTNMHSEFLPETAARKWLREEVLNQR